MPESSNNLLLIMLYVLWVVEVVPVIDWAELLVVLEPEVEVVESGLLITR